MFKQIGRTLYYDKMYGNVLVSISEMEGFVNEATIDEDIQNYTVLSERNRDTFDFIKLEFGQYYQDFVECNGFIVNPITRQIEFSYPTPDDEELQEPIYQMSLSEQVSSLESKITSLEEENMNSMLAIAEVYETLFTKGVI